MAKASLRRRLLLSFVSLACVLALAEGVVRWIGRPVTPQLVAYTSSGLEVPLGEVIVFGAMLSGSDQSAYNPQREPPYGLLFSQFKMRWGYRPRPDNFYFDANGCVPIDTNSLGLRDLEFPVQRRPDELRILALGDSMTWGMGCRLDLCWTQVLEARLRRERSGPVEVINAGFAGGGNEPGAYDAWLVNNGVHFEPDVVVIGLCLNDIDSRIGMLTYPVVPLAPVWGGYSLLLDRLVQLVRQSEVRSQKRDLGELVQPDGPLWIGTQRGLRAMRDCLQAKGIPLVVFVFPMLSQLEPDLYPCRSVHKLVTDFCAAEGIRCCDLLPAFLGRRDRDLWASDCDQHANDRGHAIQAEAIHDYLDREGLLVPRQH